jgi:hypothetical protein
MGEGVEYAAEWSGGRVINLGNLPVSTNSAAFAINNVGGVPEPSTWAMMLTGFSARVSRRCVADASPSVRPMNRLACVARPHRLKVLSPSPIG